MASNCATPTCTVSDALMRPSGASSDTPDDSAARSQLQDESSAKLDVCLEYILQFLEGGHEKSGDISEHDRAEILEAVKQTLSWKKKPRSPENVEKKLQTLNAMMIDIVSRCALRG